MKVTLLSYRIVLGAILFAIANVQAADSNTDAVEKPGSGTVKLKKGAKVYAEHCRICHGDNGDGNTRASGGLRPPPRNFRTIEAALELTPERMIKSVTEGRPGTGMMPHKDRLSKQEIEDVVEFVRSSFMPTPEASDAVVKNIEGKKIYTKNCSVCHGDKGNTAIWAQSGLNPPPRDFTSAQARRELTRERMIHSVTNGRPGTGMMPFTKKLNSEQIAQVVDYIRETFFISAEVAASLSSGTKLPAPPRDQNHARMQQGVGAVSSAGAGTLAADPHANMKNMMQPGAQPPNSPQANAQSAMNPGNQTLPAIIDADMSAPMPAGLVPDMEAGRKFFMANCYVCHGVTGEGNGPRASFNIPRPRNFTSEESRRMFNRVRLFQSITNGKVGTVMPAWRRVLSPQEISNVAEFVFQTFIRADKDDDGAGKHSNTDSGNKKKPS